MDAKHCVFRVKPSFSNSSGVVWTCPKACCCFLPNTSLDFAGFHQEKPVAANNYKEKGVQGATRQSNRLHPPAVRTEIAKRSFYYMYYGRALFNELS